MGFLFLLEFYNLNFCHFFISNGLPFLTCTEVLTTPELGWLSCVSARKKTKLGGEDGFGPVGRMLRKAGGEHINGHMYYTTMCICTIHNKKLI